MEAICSTALPFSCLASCLEWLGCPSTGLCGAVVIVPVGDSAMSLSDVCVFLVDRVFFLLAFFEKESCFCFWCGSYHIREGLRRRRV